MAFQSVRQSGKRFVETKKASEMEAGDVIQGHLVAIEESRGEFPGYNLIIRTEAGDVLVYTTGTMKYDIQDGRLTVGMMTRITAKGRERKQNKAGKKYDIAVFELEQDPEDTIEVAAFNAVFSEAASEARTNTTVASLNKGIKAQAAKLAAGVTTGTNGTNTKG
jgi:hypothetical protein